MPTLDEWIEGDSRWNSWGPLVSEYLRRTPTGAPAGTLVWNLGQMMNSKHRVTAAILQPMDTSPQRWAGTQRMPLESGSFGHESVIVKQLLHLDSADRLDELARGISPKSVGTIRPRLRVIWFAPDGRPAVDGLWDVKWQG